MSDPQYWTNLEPAELKRENGWIERRALCAKCLEWGPGARRLYL
jgi:hypothetical protein